MKTIKKILKFPGNWVLSVPVRVKIIGVGLIPVVILGLALNYWVTSGLSDWLSHILIDARVQAAMTAGRRSVTLVTVLAAIISIYVSFILSVILSHPILELREMARKVADGQLETRAKVWAHDEIGQLAIAINTMTDRLVASQKNLVRTNRRLDLLNQIATSADSQADIHDVLYLHLQKVLTAFHLKTGWIYLLDPDRQQFHLASWAGVSDELGEILLNQDFKSPCTCQKDLFQGEQVDIRPYKCDHIMGSACCGKETGHISIPLDAHGQKLGIMNLLCDPNMEILPDDKELFISVGAQISEIVSSAWLQMKLAEKELSRQALLESLVKAHEDERRRLARELHDGAGQTLTSLLVSLKTLEKKHVSTDVAPALEGMQEVVSQTIEQIRELSYRLRPAALEEFGLSMAIQTLVQETEEASNLKVSCHCELEKANLSDEAEVTLYRIAQEGLTNVLRHAHANQVQLNLQKVEGGIQLNIEDDGIGFDPQHLPDKQRTKHLGLVSMRERAAMLGGSLDVYTAPGKGTLVSIFIPTTEAINGDHNNAG